MADDPSRADLLDFLHDVGFDLRNKVAVGFGYARMLDMQRVGPLNEKQQAMVQELMKAIQSIRDITDKVFLVSTVYGRDWTLTPIPLTGLLSDVIANSPRIQSVGPVDLQVIAGADEVMGISPFMRAALHGAINGVWTHGLEASCPMSIWIVDPPDPSERWLVIAATDDIQEAVRCPRERLQPFTARSPVHLDLPVAHRLVPACGGQMLNLPTGLRGAVVALQRPLTELE